jgi:hypothetical protein
MPAPPDVHAFTQAFYDRLPQFRRDDDAEQGGSGYPLLRYLSLTLDQAGELADLVDRLPTDLTNPDTADPRWLPWLAQLAGLHLPGPMGTDERRITIRAAAGGVAAASRAALEAVAATQLTGTRYVNIIANFDGPWVIGVNTLETETPDEAALVAALKAPAVKPAGYDVEVTFYTVSWDVLEAVYPDSWDDLEQGAPSWVEVEQTHL